jgi:hypothetical protein
MDALKSIHYNLSQKKLEEEFYLRMKKADDELAKGIKEDKKGKHQNAFRHYTRGIQMMEDLSTMVKEEGPKKDIEAVINEYILRLRELRDELKCFQYKTKGLLYEPGSKEHKAAIKHFAEIVDASQSIDDDDDDKDRNLEMNLNEVFPK